MTGWPKNDTDETMKIEVVDLQNPLNSCSLPEEFPTTLIGAVGGFTKDGPLLCGGLHRRLRLYGNYYDTYSNACFTLKGSRFVEADVKLQTARYDASAVVLPNGDLWIIGGKDDVNNYLSTSETMNLQGSQTGIELRDTDTYGSPKPMAHHCSMMVNATTAFITGGTWYTRETFFIDIHNWKFTEGPQMEKARAYHGCAVFMHNNINYAVVAGGYDYDKNLKSTEILDLDSETLGWTKGK